MKIEGLPLCNGCHTCYSACPKRAIKMAASSEGFLYPEIDDSLCIKCGLCEKKCSVLNPLRREDEKANAYGVVNKNQGIRMQSSSGGIFTALAENVIKRQGIVFGAKFDSSFKVIHSWTDVVEGLAGFRGSKYVQSAIGESYKECKKFLDEGRYVLFTGTPCQIAGLTSFLGKKYEKLLLVDIICHGVPSPLLWKEYKNHLEKKSASQMVEVTFRKKDEGWKSYSVVAAFANGYTYKQKSTKNIYMRVFLKDVALRESCYDCQYKTEKRVSDITIGDFWGVQNEYPELDDDKGTSFVITHSEKGKEFIKNIFECLVREVPLDSGTRHNPSYHTSARRPAGRGTFFTDLRKVEEGAMDFQRLFRRYGLDPLPKRMYRFARRCGGRLLRRLGVRR